MDANSTFLLLEKVAQNTFRKSIGKEKFIERIFYKFYYIFYYLLRLKVLLLAFLILFALLFLKVELTFPSAAARNARHESRHWFIRRPRL